jgi:hypothetical protein
MMEHNQVAAIMRGMDPEDIGVAVSVALTWDGNAIFEAMLSALTDANFHKEVVALTKAWEDAK